ncbi:MAG: hypothetical protein JNL82_14355 [Myxococcales bacterium]|nr:hypothetical protein [Myxococcales bacterium]
MLAEHEADYTPVGVALQLLAALHEEVDAQRSRGAFKPERILDPSAGSGCWGRAARALWPDAYIIGVEPRASERENILAAYDEAHTMYCAEYLATGPESFDLVATNPPFSVAFGAGTFWPIEFLRAGILHAESFVMLYGLSQWGQGNRSSTPMQAWSPWMQFRLGGRVGHRGDGCNDLREYCGWSWSAEDGRLRRHLPSWRTIQLPVLDAPLRRWSPDNVPGTCAVDKVLVDLVRGGL